MRDIQVFRFVDNITVLKIDVGETHVVLTVNPSSSNISAIEVLDNNVGIKKIKASSISILTQTTLSFEKPSHFDADYLTAAYTFETHSITSDKDVKILFDPGEKIVSVSGTQKLIQQVVKILLTTAGSNRFNKSEGGNLLDSLGSNPNKGSIDLQIASVEDAISRTETFILNQQIGQKLPADERLLSIDVEDFRSDDGETLQVSVRIVTVGGNTSTIPLSI